VEIEAKDGVKIRGWLMKQRSAAPSVIFFHENAGNIGLRLDLFEMLFSK